MQTRAQGNQTADAIGSRGASEGGFRGKDTYLEDAQGVLVSLRMPGVSSLLP